MGVGLVGAEGVLSVMQASCRCVLLTYDAWGRVLEQRGCCGSGEGIEVVAVAAQYNAAGRKRFEKELRSDGSVMRTIEYDYDELGRFRYATDGQQQVIYRYDSVGRLWQIEYPDRELIEYIYYGADTPTQTGYLKRVEHRAPDGTLQNGTEYLYDLLGRVKTITELPTGNRVELGYDRVGHPVREERTGEPYYLISRVYQLDGQLEQEYVETAWESQSVVVWRLYDYDEIGRLRGAYDLLGGPNGWFEWEQDRLVRWHADDRNYVREFMYDEEGRIQQVWLSWEASGQRVLGYEYRFNGDGERVYWRAALDRLEFYRWCGGLSEWYREEGSSSWALWRQSLLDTGCGSCGKRSQEWNMRAWVDASLLPDGDYQPRGLMAAIPVACAIACGCAAVCAIGAIVPCVRDCWGRPDPIGCVKQCVGDTVRELPRWAQILCGACLLGCAVCLVLLPFRPFPPGRSPQPPVEPPGHPKPQPEPPSNPPPGPGQPRNGKDPHPPDRERRYPWQPGRDCQLLEAEELRNPLGESLWLCTYTCPLSGRISFPSLLPCSYRIRDPFLSPN